MNIEKIKSLVLQLESLDTYKVNVDSDGFLYCERHVEGQWMNSESVYNIVEELKRELV